ncbi:hypothetical protein GF327_02960 [Candidatus Woesearchaeota archaeon]|nr:hypothetical protein [Candidatus Woesearchaeota archaeon]
MKCPECGSVETIKDSEGIFCKKCGLELEEEIIYSRGRGSRLNAEKPVILPELIFDIDSKKELYSLKLGLKHNKLTSDWTKLLGFKLKNNYLKPGLKKTAEAYIKKAISKNKNELKHSKEGMEKNWKKINKNYWVNIEKVLDYKWQSENYLCYLSLVCNGGYHNSANNFIIIQYRWEKMSNYVISHELFHIIFRKYINRFFREKYDDFDEDLSEAIVNIVLLYSDKMKSNYPDIKFSFDIYGLKKHREIAKKILPIWKTSKNFKNFLIDSYTKLGRDKTWISY